MESAKRSSWKTKTCFTLLRRLSLPRPLSWHSIRSCGVLMCREMINDVPHPLYSPDPATCDFTLFPKMKLNPKDCCFDSVDKSQTYCNRRRNGRPWRKGLPLCFCGMKDVLGQVLNGTATKNKPVVFKRINLRTFWYHTQFVGLNFLLHVFLFNARTSTQQRSVEYN